MIAWLGIFIGGGLGSMLRCLVSSKVGNHWGIMLVNICGALLIGLAYQFFMTRADLRPEIKTFIITGFLGGFTTFSTFMLDFGLLVNGQRVGEAAAYLGASVLLGVAFLYLGIVVGRHIYG